MNEINRIFAVITLMLLGVVSVSAYTEVPGISGPTWQDLRESYGGKGTKEEPYVIERPTQLAQLAYEVNTDMLNLSGKYFILGADIDLSSRKMQDDHLNNVVPSWVPIGMGNIAGDKCFKGIFSNPHGYVIKNMIIRVSEYGELKNYGLFGRLKGHIDGLRMKGVTIEGGSDEYCGAVCGNADNGAVMTSVGNCLVEDVNIFTYDGSVGGIAGVVDHCLLKNCVVKGATLQGLYCGGIVGYFNDEHFSNGDDQFAIDNCHSVADIRVSGAGNYYGHGHAGGIVGSADGNPKQVIQYCSASGSITTVSKNRMGLYYGGLVGFLHHMNVENSCSSVTLSEGTIMGGLVGCMKAPSNVLFCFANGYIDATLSDWKKLDAWGMYAGGLVGYIDNNSISEGDVYLGYSLSAGSMLEPQEIPDDAREYYTFGFGSVVGYAKKSSNFGDTMNGLTVDKNLCRLPAIPAEFGEIADVKMMKTKELTSDDDPYKSFYKMPIDMLERYKKQYNTDVAFPDNFMLAAVPFYVKDEHFAHYNVWQVTTKFDITPLAYNRATQKALASFYFQQRQDDLDFLNIEEDAESAVKTVTPLDPGEADVVVEYAGLHRTIHLDITYGVPWNDKEPKEFPGGNGAKNDPYIIQNVSQLITAANSEVYNRDDMYFRLSNDIFFNTHLIQKDEKAKAGAKPWTPVEWHANLDGNGKTLYGLYVSTYVNKTYKEEDPNYYSDTRKDFSMSGLFSELFGHVHDMAIVDSYVNMNLAGTSLASLCTGLYAGLIRGGASIERCLAHGIVLGPRNMCGGFVGFGYQLDGELGNISDCFSCVHVMGKEWGSSSFSSGTAGGGITGGWACDHITRCVSVGKVEDFSSRRGIGTTNQNSDEDSKTWYFDKQQMTSEYLSSGTQRRGDCTTEEMIQGDIFTDQPAWQHEKGRYPMLRQFANTPYGDILSMPVHFADGDRAGRVTKIFEFPMENVTWAAVSDDTYVDIINECGAATPMSTGIDHIFAETIDDALVSKCSKALRVMQVDVNVPAGTIVGIQFEDPKCEAAWLTAFEKTEGEVVTLRNAYTVSKNQANIFNANAQQLHVEKFNEMRYFVGIRNLLAGMLSDISTLSEVQLPKQLEYIDQEAFRGCTKLAEVTLPATTQMVAGGAFDGSSVTDIMVEPRCTAFEVRDHALFTTNEDRYLVAYPPARGERTITLHGPFHNIMYHALYKIPQLDEIYIDYPKPEGSVIQMDDDEAIVHWNADNGQLMDIYINDGSFDGMNYHYATGGNFDGILMKEFLTRSYWQTYADAGMLHRYFPLTVGDDGWATMYIGFCTQLPPELKAYVTPESLNDLYSRGESQLTLKRVSNLLHHTVPVVVKAEQPGTYILRPYEGTVPNIPMTANKLQGTDIGQNNRYGIPVNQSEIQNEFSVLTLGYDSSETLGFYGYTGEVLPPYTAYMYFNWIEVSPSAAAPVFSIVIDDTMEDAPTRINDLHPSPLTNHPSPIYDLSGRQVNEDYKGVVIQHGKKTVMK